jgi:hypothetical protein
MNGRQSPVELREKKIQGISFIYMNTGWLEGRKKKIKVSVGNCFKDGGT